MSEPHEMRISDVDREEVAEVLRSAAGEGRLDLDELEERLESTYAAKTCADLAPLVRHLPHHLTGPLARPVPPPGWGPASRPAVMSGGELRRRILGS